MLEIVAESVGSAFSFCDFLKNSRCARGISFIYMHISNRNFMKKLSDFRGGLGVGFMLF